MQGFSLIPLSFVLCYASAFSVMRATEPSPSVSIQNGTVVGQTDRDFGIDNFIGIPFAQPPIQSLRLRPPQSINVSFGTLDLPYAAHSCPQQRLSTLNVTGLPEATLQAIEASQGLAAASQNEDCLTLTIQRPAKTRSDANLPVLFYIYGGGYEVGSTSSYNATKIIDQSVAMGQPIIFVAVNYRLSAFGFLGGKEIQADGSSNLGLRDQRLGMEWVAENIAAFGGDPSKVTIWGESAGSFSVFNHLVINRGDNDYHGKPLFRAAIMDSGSALPVTAITSTRPQADYDQVVSASGCSHAADTLECLRSVPFETLSNASSTLPNFLGYNSVGRGFSSLPRGDPSSEFFPSSPDVALSRGHFARVPVIIGDQEDEGTLFSLQQRNLTTVREVVDYFAQQYPIATREDVAGLVATYANNPAARSPYRTGTANQLYPQYKTVASMNGDFTFTLRRRQALATLANSVPSWSYLATYLYGLPFLGTYHTTDVLEVFAGSPNTTIGMKIAQYYIHFVTGLNPNGENLTNWPSYCVDQPLLLNMSSAGVSTLEDNFRDTSYDYLVAKTTDFSL